MSEVDQVALPGDWLDQIIQSHRALSNTQVGRPDTLVLPTKWRRAIANIVDTDGTANAIYNGGVLLGTRVVFGVVDAPVAGSAFAIRKGPRGGGRD